MHPTYEQALADLVRELEAAGKKLGFDETSETQRNAAWRTSEATSQIANALGLFARQAVSFADEPFFALHRYAVADLDSNVVGSFTDAIEAFEDHAREAAEMEPEAA